MATQQTTDRQRDTVAFSAYRAATQAIGSGWNQMQYDTVTYDYGGNFASYAFTAPVDGIYHIGARMNFVIGNERTIMSLYKNGSEIIRGIDIEHQEATPAFNIRTNSVVGDLLLDAEDIITGYCYTDDGLDTTGGIIQTGFYGHLVRTV